MTRPFLMEEECREADIQQTESVAETIATTARESEAATPLVPQSDHVMFTRAKFSRFEVLPPVLCTRRVYVQVAFLLLIGLIIFLVRMMSAVKGTFMHYHLESDTDGELVILPSEFAKSRGAVCLDGSPPAYYYRQGVVPAVHYWIIHLQSGGWCTSPENCLKRSETALGSSLKTEMSKPLEGIMSSDCHSNPDFCMWHMVDFVYCDGGSFLGNRSDPVIMDSKELYMRGALVFDALMEYLSTFTSFKEAQQIILAGSSAGSLGALMHADRLRERLPPTMKTLHVLVDGGLFIDVLDIVQDHTMANMLKDVFFLHHTYNAISLKECTHMMNKDEEWRCMLPETVHKYVFTPIYFINSLYDNWFRSAALRINCTVELCSDRNLREVVNARIKLLQETEEILQSQKNGVFLTSCPIHTVLMKNRFFVIKSQGYSVQQGLGAWMSHRGSVRKLIEVLEVSDALRKCPSLL